jgi:hypothetical protein
MEGIRASIPGSVKPKPAPPSGQEASMDLKHLAWVALVLFAVWVVAGLIFKVAGAAIHLLVIAAVIMGLISLVSRVRRPGHHT